MRPVATTTMHHAKTDSEGTSLDPLSPPRSPRRPVYFVQSPSQHDVEKMSYGSSPMGSPPHHSASYPHYHHGGGSHSPIHHSRESSTSRFSVSLKNPRHSSGSIGVGGSGGGAHWKKLTHRLDFDDDEDVDDGDGGYRGGDRLPCHPAKFYSICFVFSFAVLFTVFSLILWAASAPYGPKVSVKGIVFESFNLQAGLDGTGVPTDMLSLNSTVRILYRNPATFFGVHVTATPLELYYYKLKIASGYMKKFYQSRKSQRTVKVVVQASQVAVYGGVSLLGSMKDHPERVVLPLNLTFVMRSRAFVLGRLVKPKFYDKIRCSVTLRGNQMGKHNNLTHSCTYH